MSDMKKSIILSLLGFVLFSVSDILTKYMLQTYNVLDVRVWTSLLAVVSVSLFAPRLGGFKSLKTITKPHIHFIKSVLITFLMIFAVFALDRLSLDVYYTLIFTTPLVVSILAVFLFKEKLPFLKLCLVIFGFLGVIVIMRPGSNIDIIGFMMAMGVVVGFSFNVLLNKYFSPEEPKFPFGFFPYLMCAVVFYTINKGVLPDIKIHHFILFFVIGASGCIAMISHVHAFQIAKAAVPAPYQYSQLLWGVLFGYILFHDIPDIWTMVGASIIIGSGILMYMYDNRQPEMEKNV